MSYVNRVLQPGEVVRHVASLHWILYVPGLGMWILAGVLLIAAPDPSTHGVVNRLAVIGAWLCFAVGLVLIARAWFKWWTTEIAVTDRRIIYKTGFIQRRSKEINMNNVASVDVNQSIAGRILDYGEVVVHSTGGKEEELIADISAPLDFRNHVTAA